MKTYEGANIRNVAVVGHSHSGKTSLVSAMLFTAGATQRLAGWTKATPSPTTTKRKSPAQMTISAALATSSGARPRST